MQHLVSLSYSHDVGKMGNISFCLNDFFLIEMGVRMRRGGRVAFSPGILNESTDGKHTSTRCSLHVCDNIVLYNKCMLCILIIQYIYYIIRTYILTRICCSAVLCLCYISLKFQKIKKLKKHVGIKYNEYIRCRYLLL